MALTYAQQLDNVQTAITALEASPVKKFKLPNGTEYEYKELEALYQREERLLRFVSGGASVAIENRVVEL